MSLEKLVSKYIVSAEHVFKVMQVTDQVPSISFSSINHIISLARDYLEDAKYYRDRNQLEVSLASIAYCEGLLDALRLLGMVRFEWPKTVENEKSS
ncbi:MAG: DUF357 domain-containing protein [Candidatus Bathyarchaeia archaeon]|nr:DUF357 domain-containing protein [Candidatus Bathyarchaeota archaeon]